MARVVGVSHYFISVMIYFLGFASKKIYHKRIQKKRTRDLWNTRRESQNKQKLDQPS